MSAASALITGTEASPHLAGEAVRMALEKAGLERANGVLLFLSADFSRHPMPALRAAIRAAGCLQVCGLTVPGLFTESGWTLDQPAAAALVLGGNLGLSPQGDGPLLAFSEDTALPPDWFSNHPRLGLLHHGGTTWQQGRLGEDGRAEGVLLAPRWKSVVSPGIQALGTAERVGSVRALDLLTLGEQTAVDSLARRLPPALRPPHPLPVHQLCALVDGRIDLPSIPLLAANADGSITLARAVDPGQRLGWGLRLPLIAENDQRRALAQAASEFDNPACGIMLSCIGRGPLFYGGEDHDLAVWRHCFPGIPLIGAYAHGQLSPGDRATQVWQNACVTTLLGDARV